MATKPFVYSWQKKFVHSWQQNHSCISGYSIHNSFIIQFHRFLKDKVQPQVERNDIVLDSFIVSNTDFNDVQWKSGLTIQDFNNENVYFQRENVEEYIEKILAIG